MAQILFGENKWPISQEANSAGTKEAAFRIGQLGKYKGETPWEAKLPRGGGGEGESGVQTISIFNPILVRNYSGHHGLV